MELNPRKKVFPGITKSGSQENWKTLFANERPWWWNGSGVCWSIHFPLTCCKLYMSIELMFTKSSHSLSKEHQIALETEETGKDTIPPPSTLTFTTWVPFEEGHQYCAVKQNKSTYISHATSGPNSAIHNHAWHVPIKNTSSILLGSTISRKIKEY